MSNAPTWQTSAACAGHDADLWHVEGKDADAVYSRRAAVRVCNGCIVRNDCLNYAMRTEARGPDHRFGVWGGLTATERDQLARTRDTQRVAAGQDRDQWENVGEPDRSASTLQPGSDRLHLGKKGGGW